MKIYQGLPSDFKAFDLEENEYEELRNDVLNGKKVVIKCKDDYVKMIKNTKANSCGSCFFYQQCNDFLNSNHSFACCSYKIMGDDKWKFYEFKKIDEYEVVFG